MAKTKKDISKNSGFVSSGTHHWWHLKLASLALLPLSLWVFFNLIHIFTSQMHYSGIKAWIAEPLNAGFLSLFVVVAFYHAAIGGQEVIVDYVSDKNTNRLCMVLYYLANIIGALIGLYAIFNIVLAHS